MKILTASLRGGQGARPSWAPRAANRKWNQAFETLSQAFPSAFGMNATKARAYIVGLAQTPGLQRFVARLNEGSDWPAKALPTPEEVAFSFAFEMRRLEALDPATVRAMAERLLQLWPQPTAMIRACDSGIDEALADVFLMKKGYFRSFEEEDGDDVIRVFLGDKNNYVDVHAGPDKYVDVRVDRRQVEVGFFRVAYDYYLQDAGLLLERPNGERQPWLKAAFRHRKQPCESALFFGEDDEAFEAEMEAREAGSKTIWQKLLGSTGRDLVWLQ